jgi:hypothetical protein
MANPFVSKDGSKHTNHDSMKRSDARFGAKQPQKQGGQSAGMMGGGEGDGSEDYNAGAEEQADGSQMAAEHGPATDISMQHDHEGGLHTVHAKHPDGHEHDSEHGSAGEAHQFAGDCAGCGMGGE